MQLGSFVSAKRSPRTSLMNPSEETSLTKVLSAIEDLKKDTNVQLIKVGRRINALERRVSVGSCQESEESELVDEEDGASTEGYEFGENQARRKKLLKKKSTASPLRSNRRVRSADITSSGFAAIQSDDLQAEFQSIKESVARQRLPKDLKFNGTTRGIKAQFCDVAKLHAVSGKYLETCIKIASNIQSHKDSEEYDVSGDIEDLLICMISHMRYIQEEHCMLLVGGNYGSRTQQIFRSIHANPSQYTSTIIEELRTSAALASLPMENPANSNNRWGRDSREYRHDYRQDYRGGFRNNGFRGRGRGNNTFHGYYNNDNTPGFRSRQVPTDRQTEEQ